MDDSDISNIKNRIDFNKTEYEVLNKLVIDANKKGEKIQKENKRLKNKSKEILNTLIKNNSIILTETNLSEDFNPEEICSVGIDGSFYLVGGVGGKWYSPYSVARIIFSEGIKSAPGLDIYAAGIEEIDEQKNPNVNGEAALRMLIGETMAIENWGSKNIKSIVFIDGPIADPPSYNNKNYIENRCRAIKKCLENSLLIGCVKRSRDKFFVKYFEKLLNCKDNNIGIDFMSDQYIFAYFFSNYRFENNYKGTLFSNLIDISDHETYNIYKEFGIYTFTIFYQKSIDSKILRLDIPINKDNLNDIEDRYLNAVTACSRWHYPKQYVPLPIELAHEKCKIREGVAEILYDEILTKSRSTDLEDQITMMQLR